MQFKILLVEDNPGDVELTKEALNRSPVNNHLSIANDGEEALNFLFKRGEFSTAPRPDIIFLDLNLPKVDGREVLKAVKSDPNLKTIPVIMLSSSEAPSDLRECYENHANCFVTKPLQLDDFINAIQTVEAYWANAVQLCPK